MTNKPVEFHEEAAEEYTFAIDWYFQRSRLAALKFSEEVTSSIAQIKVAPLRGPSHILGTRRFVLRHFPFSVVYRELPALIQVIAVAHARRRPGYWRNRV